MLQNLSLKALGLMSSIFLSLFLLFNSLSRIVLYVFALYEQQIEFNIIELIQVLSLGVINDLVTSFYIMAIFALITLALPNKLNKIFKPVTYFFYFLVVASLSFLIVSEFTFWLEFSSRFNFIAVDYLVYTQEVIGNVVESYPIILIFSILGLVSVIFYFFIHSIVETRLNITKTYKTKFNIFLCFTAAAILSFFFYNPKITDINDNNYLSELSKNGLYNLFSAFRHNVIDYSSFYQTRNTKEGLIELSKYITLKDQKTINPEILERRIKTNGPAHNYNIFLITVESLSSVFLQDKENFTPVISELTKHSLYFNNLYAAGTRTVRGLEAITLSIPPTPGQSIVRRNNNENLFSIATILRQENYDIKFIYGGYGYFDNMNYFFSKNGFKIWDRSNIPEKEINFANVWGISDEDLYLQAIKQADQSYQNNQKFFSLLMTTSNHRPYTYPDGKIDIPSGAGRHGGVKYSDYALGEFLKAARNKPWFDNTIFVITADHCAGSGGKVALPPAKYHIPLLIYAPKIVKSKVISKLSSQIDIAPTILGLLNISYSSRFFGNDILNKNYQNAFISTYQKLGYIENKKLITLSPGKVAQTYNLLDNNQLEETDLDQVLVNRAIDYYQSAYYLYQNGQLKQNIANDQTNIKKTH